MGIGVGIHQNPAFRFEVKAGWGTAEVDQNVVKSGRNIAGCQVTFANLLNVYDVLHADKLVVDQASLAKIVEVFA